MTKTRGPLGRIGFSWMKLGGIGLFIVCAGCFVFTGCSSQPTPTLLPTLAMPTAADTPQPAPASVKPTPTPLATNFATWRSVRLQDHQSYDFRQEKMGALTEGDLYYSPFSSRQGTACFWADNVDQVGGRDLGAWPLTALTERPLPRDRFSGQCIPVVRSHVYVFGMRGDERLAVFRVSDTGPDWVDIDYVLRE
jgi:hypothetical protein